jgi:hypothetical protein
MVRVKNFMQDGFLSMVLNAVIGYLSDNINFLQAQKTPFLSFAKEESLFLMCKKNASPLSPSPQKAIF